MRIGDVRKLPVVDGHGAPAGVLTIDDLTEFLAGEMVEVARISPRKPELAINR